MEQYTLLEADGRRPRQEEVPSRIKTTTLKKAKRRKDPKILCSLSGDFIFRHRGEPRTRQYDPEEEPLPIPLKYVDVMRRTKTYIDSVSGHVINDMWTEAKDVDLSEAWSGTTRCQILCT